MIYANQWFFLWFSWLKSLENDRSCGLKANIRKPNGSRIKLTLGDGHLHRIVFKIYILFAHLTPFVSFEWQPSNWYYTDWYNAISCLSYQSVPRFHFHSLVYNPPHPPGSRSLYLQIFLIETDRLTLDENWELGWTKIQHCNKNQLSTEVYI